MLKEHCNLICYATQLNYRYWTSPSLYQHGMLGFETSQDLCLWMALNVQATMCFSGIFHSACGLLSKTARVPRSHWCNWQEEYKWTVEWRISWIWNYICYQSVLFPDFYREIWQIKLTVSKWATYCNQLLVYIVIAL